METVPWAGHPMLKYEYMSVMVSCWINFTNLSVTRLSDGDLILINYSLFAHIITALLLGDIAVQDLSDCYRHPLAFNCVSVCWSYASVRAVPKRMNRLR